MQTVILRQGMARFEPCMCKVFFSSILKKLRYDWSRSESLFEYFYQTNFLKVVIFKPNLRRKLEKPSENVRILKTDFGVQIWNEILQ